MATEWSVRAQLQFGEEKDGANRENKTLAGYLKGYENGIITVRFEDQGVTSFAFEAQLRQVDFGRVCHQRTSTALSKIVAFQDEKTTELEGQFSISQQSLTLRYGVENGVLLPEDIVSLTFTLADQFRVTCHIRLNTLLQFIVQKCLPTLPAVNT